MRTKSEAKRAAILQAAKKQFLEAGNYATVSMDAIADQGNVSKQTLYGYFATKETLFLAVVKGIIGEPWKDEFPRQRFEQAATPRDFAAALLQLLKVVRSKFSNYEYLAVIRIVIAESKTQPELATLYKEQVIDKAFGGVTGVLASAHAKDLIQADPERGARMLIGTMMTYVLMRGIFDPEKAGTTIVTDDELRLLVADFMTLHNKGEV